MRSEAKPRNAVFEGVVKKGSYEETRKAGEVREKPGQGLLLRLKESVSSSFYIKMEQ